MRFKIQYLSTMEDLEERVWRDSESLPDMFDSASEAQLAAEKAESRGFLHYRIYPIGA